MATNPKNHKFAIQQRDLQQKPNNTNFKLIFNLNKFLDILNGDQYVSKTMKIVAIAVIFKMLGND